MASPDQMDWTPTDPGQALPQQSAPPPGHQSGFQSINNVQETTACPQPDASHPSLMTSASLRSERPQPNHSIFDATEYHTPVVTIRSITAPHPNFDLHSRGANIGNAHLTRGHRSLTGRSL